MAASWSAVARGQQEIAQTSPPLSSDALSVATDAERAERELKRSDGLRPETMAAFANYPSIGTLIHWNSSEIARPLKLDSKRTEILAEQLAKRKVGRESNLARLQTLLALEKTRSGEAADKAAEKDFRDKEHQLELELDEALNEILRPAELEALCKMLATKSPYSIGSLPTLAKHFELNPAQAKKFDRALELQFTTAFSSTDEKKMQAWREATVAANNSLTHEQHEKFNRTIGRMPPDQTLEEFFAGLPRKDQDRMARTFHVFHEIRRQQASR